MRSEEKIAKHRIVSILADLLRSDQACYLVGGAIRDAMLGRPVNDLDFTMGFDPTELARTLGRKMGAAWFFLDEERRQSRVVMRREGEETTCDFAPFRAPDLSGDLRLRDFTINAMALKVAADSDEIFDPLGGKGDLQEKRLRACSPGVFDDDPLRVLKGIRHAAVLGFSLEEETHRLMSAAAGDLARIAPERLRAEMAAVFSVQDPKPALDLLRDFGLEAFFFGTSKSGKHFETGIGFLSRAGAILEWLFNQGDDAVRAVLAEEIEGGIGRAALLRMAALLRGYAPAGTESFASRVRLGRMTSGILRSLDEVSAERAEQIGRLPEYPRGRALWVAESGPDAWMNLLFLGVLAGRPIREIAPVLLRLGEDLREALKGNRIPDLVGGDWLRKELGWSEGPVIGRALTRVRRMEAAGRVTSVRDARNYLKSLDQKMIDNNSNDPL